MGVIPFRNKLNVPATPVKTRHVASPRRYIKLLFNGIGINFVNRFYESVQSERNSGFTLIELIIVLVVIALALIPILSTFSSSHQNTRATLEEIIATNIASELIEPLQALPYDQIKLFDSNITLDTAGNMAPDPFELAKLKNNFPGLSFKLFPNNFQVNLVVEPFPPAASIDSLKVITLKIKWGSRNQEIILTTLKGNL